MDQSRDLSYIHQPSKEPLMYLTLGQLLERCADKYRDKCAVISKKQGMRLTYHEVLNWTDKLAAGLSVLGLKRGEMLGIWAPNLIEWYITYLACARAGLIAVCINPASTASEIKFYLNKVKVKAIVCPCKDKHQNFFDVLKEIIPELESLKDRRCDSLNVPSLKHVILISQEKIGSQLTYNEVLDMANEDEIAKIRSNQHLTQPEEPCNIQFSSGTTGAPKAAIQTHMAIINNSYYTSKAFNFEEKQHKNCPLVPLFHSYGTIVVLVGSLHFGSTLVLSSPNYNPEQHLNTLVEEKCTIIFGTPTMYLDLMSVQKVKKEHLELDVAVMGSAPSSPQFTKQMKKILNIKKVKLAYGLTETTACVFASLPTIEDDQNVFETIGHLCDNFEVKVVDEHNKIVPFGTPGELYVRGYSNIPAYFEDEEKTKELYTCDRWLRTGDQFILRKDGYGKIVGRLKDVIIRGGENIFPQEIEDYLITHKDIIECQVIGLPHERLGEEVCACVRLTEEASFDLESLRNFCKDKMARFKIPSRLEIVDKFPKTESGKIQKHLLKKQFVLN